MFSDKRGIIREKAFSLCSEGYVDFEMVCKMKFPSYKVTDDFKKTHNQLFGTEDGFMCKSHCVMIPAN